MAKEEPKEIKKLRRWDQQYHNEGNSEVSDKKYDVYKEKAKALYPKHRYFKEVGAPVDQGKKIKLDTIAGSLEKETPATLMKWISKFKPGTEFICGPKLDGFSAQVRYDPDGKMEYVATRGKGTVGRDITTAAKHVMGIKYASYFPGDTMEVRGEICMPTATFERYYANKEFNGKVYKSPRNFCVGVFARVRLDKETIKALNRMIFVAHNVTCSKLDNRTEKDKLIGLETGFITVNKPQPYLKSTTEFIKEKVAENGAWLSMSIRQAYRGGAGPNCLGVYKKEELTEETIYKIFSYYDTNCIVDRDGIVIKVNDPKLIKKLGFERNGLNPAYARSVKLDRNDQESKEVSVQKIRWTYTKRGLYKPTLQIPPTRLKGADISNVFVDNAKYVQKMGLGKGAVVQIVRSGDIIPRVINVIKKAKKTDIPKLCEHCSTKLEWTDVDVFCPNQKCEGTRYEQIQALFRLLKLPEIGPGVIDKLWENGIDTLPAMLTVTKKKLLKIEGFAEKKAEHVAKTIVTALHGIDMAELMHLSSCFSTETASLGSTILRAVVETVGVKKLLNPKNDKAIRIACMQIENFGLIRVNIFMNNLPAFRQWYKTIEGHVKLKKLKKIEGGKLSGQTVVVSGFRDSSFRDKVESLGGKYSETLTKATNILVFKPGGKSSTKVDKAAKQGTKVLTLDDFNKKYA